MLEENIITHEVEKMVESVIDGEIISGEDIHMTKRSEVYTRKERGMRWKTLLMDIY